MAAAGRSEKSILNETLVAVSSQPETLVWRNNTGMAWQGRKVELPTGATIRIEPGMVILRDARPVKFGVPGSGDIIGARSRRPLAVETKTLIGQQRESQVHFQRAWEKAGGIYVLARSPDEALSGIEAALREPDT